MLDFVSFFSDHMMFLFYSDNVVNHIDFVVLNLQ